MGDWKKNMQATTPCSYERRGEQWCGAPSEVMWILWCIVQAPSRGAFTWFLKLIRLHGNVGSHAIQAFHWII